MSIYSLHPQFMKKPGIIFRHHDTEADVLSVQTLEGGAVAYHEPDFYAALEYIEGCHALFHNPQQDKVRVRLVGLIIRIRGQRLIKTIPLGEDETAGPVNVSGILEHQFSGEGSDAV